VFSALGQQFAALQWHGDTFGLPSGAGHLTSSPAYQSQAFRIGDVGYAVQFHVEVTRAMLAEWQHIPAYHASAEAALGPDGFGQMAAAFAAAEDEMAESAARLLSGWLALTDRPNARPVSA
jgi:GMP synthase-like glutamine amidotransferase